MDGVKASRKAHSGVLTRARNKLDVIPFEHPDEVKRIKLTDVKSILKTLDTTEAGFSASMEEAQDFAPVDEDELATFQEEELEVAEAFHDRLHVTRTLGEQILACKTIHTGVTTFKTRLDALQTSLDAEPDRDHSTSLTRLQTLLYSLREQWEETDLPTEHTLQADLDRCEVLLSHKTGAVSAARSRSTPPTPPLSSTMASITSTGAVSNYSKLPMIKVPTFSGDIMGWSTFWATFESTVDSRPELNSSQKLNYLRQAIKDPALQLLMNSPLEGPDTYQDLVDELKDRFQKKKEIHQAVVKTITTIFSPKYTRADLRLFYDTLKTSITNLKSTSHYDIESFLSSLAYSILPNKLQILWDQATKTQKGVLPVTDLLAFIKDHAETLPAAATHPAEKPAPAKKEQFKGRNSVHTTSTAPAATSASPPVPYKWDCVLCKPEKHPLHVCSRWAELSLAPKLTLIETHALCSNCLHKGHTTEACRSKYRCTICKQKHHTSIHQQAASVTVNHATPICRQLPDALMTTAQLLLIGPNGVELKARALIDSGAGISLVTLRAAQTINLSLKPAKLRLAVVQGEVSTPLNYITQLQLSPLHNRALKIPCKPAVADIVTTNIPSQPVPSVTDMPHLRGLHLADEKYNLPGHIDILLGAEMASKIFTRRPPQKGKPTEPMAQATEFGWSILGPVPGLQHSPSMLHLLPRIQAEPSFPSETQPETLSTPLLQEEEGARDVTPTQLDQQVEKHYSNNVTYSPTDQRYTVCLLKRNCISDLGKSQPRTLSRFLTNENVSTMLVEAHHTSEPLLPLLSTTNDQSSNDSVSKTEALQPPLKKLLTFTTDLLKSQPVSRNDIMEHDPAALQPALTTSPILGEVILPKTPSAECQTPQQIPLHPTSNIYSSTDSTSKPESQQQLPRNLPTSQSSTNLTTRSQPPAITPNHCSLRKITLPHNLSAECQTPQQIRLPQATAPFLPNVSKKPSGENASSILQLRLHQATSLLEELDTVKLAILFFEQPQSSIRNLLLMNNVSSSHATSHYWIDKSIYLSWLHCQKQQRAVTSHQSIITEQNTTLSNRRKPQATILHNFGSATESSAAPPLLMTFTATTPSCNQNLLQLLDPTPQPADLLTDDLTTHPRHRQSDVATSSNRRIKPKEKIQETDETTSSSSTISREVISSEQSEVLQPDFRSNHSYLHSDKHCSPNRCNQVQPLLTILWSATLSRAFLLFFIIIHPHPVQGHRPSSDATDYFTSTRINLPNLRTRFGHPHFYTSNRVRLRNWNNSSSYYKTSTIKNVSLSYHLPFDETVKRSLIQMALIYRPGEKKQDQDQDQEQQPQPRPPEPVQARSS